ncbi:hypothetical protein AB0C83_41340, partial [Streptomyces sp. NPDC048663]
MFSARRDLNAEVIRTLNALYDYYEPHYETDTVRFFANRRSPLRAAAQFARLTDVRSDATLHERMDALADAVYANHDYPNALSKLWAVKPELNPMALSGVPDSATPYAPETLRRAREYGHQFAAVPPVMITHLLRVRRVLNVPDGNLMFFRDALIAWGVSSHSLAEVLLATQQANVRGGVEPSGPIDAARLYAWSDAQLDPRSAISSLPTRIQGRYGVGSSVWNSLRQPHERWYHELWSAFDARARKVLGEIAALAGLEGEASVLPVALPTQRRRALMEVWERQGTKHGVRNIRAGHLLGLYLATGPDRRLIQARPALGTAFSPEEFLRPVPEPTARSLVLQAWRGKGEYPALFRTDEMFRQRLDLAERARGVHASGRTLTDRREKLIQRAVELAEAGSAMSFRGYEELASEAVERLMPVHRRTYFGERVSGPVEGPHTFGNVEGVIRKRPLYTVSVNRQSLLEELSSAAEPDSDHVVLYEVLNSSAREVAPFLPAVREADLGKALYPREMSFRSVGSRVERDERLGLSYVVATVEEIFQPLPPEAWDWEIQNHNIRDRNGAHIGISFVGSTEWSSVSEPLKHVAEASTYRTYQGSNHAASDEEHQVPWKPGHVGWLDLHGTGQSLLIASRYGPKFASGFQVGAHAKQLLASAGVPDIPIVYLSCLAARDQGVSTVMAQNLANGTGTVGFAAPTAIRFPQVGKGVTERGTRLPGSYLSVQVTADHPAPRFTRFEPQPLVDAVGPETLAQQGVWAEGLYTRPMWADHARGYETALASRLSTDGEVLHVARHALEAAGGGRPTNTDLAEVMTGFFARVLPERRLREFDASPLSDDDAQAYYQRGLLVTRREGQLPGLLFNAYKQLVEPSYPQLLTFRKAVVAWLVGTSLPYAHSLFEVIRASTAANVGFDHVADSIAVTGSAAHLYLWADQALAPRDPEGRTRPTLPMYTFYRSLTRDFLAPRITRDGRIPAGIVRVLEGAVADDDVPRSGLSDRLDALANWRSRHDGNLLHMLGGKHITALHLLSGPDGPVFDLWRSVRTPTRAGLHEHLRDIVVSALDSRTTLPWLLMRDTVFRRHARAAAVQFGQMQNADSTGAKWHRGEFRHHKNLALEAVAAAADTVYEDVPLHMAVATQGLRRMPPVGTSVFWAVHDPAPLTGRAGERPSGELHTMWVPELHGASLYKDVALSGMEMESGRVRVFEVVHARHAVDVSPIAWNPALGQTFFRQETLLHVSSREIREHENSDGDVMLYEHIVLREVDEMPRYAAPLVDPTRLAHSESAPHGSPLKNATPSGTTLSTRWFRIKNADGNGVVLAQFTRDDWNRREPEYRPLADGPRAFVHWRTNESGQAARQSLVQELIDGGLVFYARHGSSEPADQDRIRNYLDLDSAEHIMLLECGTSAGQGESSDDEELTADERAERNRLLAKQLGKTVWWPHSPVAVTRSPDGTSAQIHLHEAADGSPSNMVYSVKGAPAQLGFEGAVKPVQVPQGTRRPSNAEWNSTLPSTTLGLGGLPEQNPDAEAGAPLQSSPVQLPSFSIAPELLQLGQIDADTAQIKFGLTKDDYAKFREISQSRGVVIDLLPGNPTSVKWRAQGAIPKPSAVKAKSIREIDIPLGADPQSLGLVGFFSPQTPVRGDRGDTEWETLLARYNQRRSEYMDLGPVMRRLEDAGVIAVESGVVHAVRDGRRLPMSGDEDVYNITDLDGNRVADDLHDEIIQEMIDSGAAVTHGAFRFWSPSSPTSKLIYKDIVLKHRPGGEPLIRFHPADTFASLTWDGIREQEAGSERALRSASLAEDEAGLTRRMRLHPALELMKTAGSATFHRLEGTDWVARTISNRTGGGNAESITEQLLLHAESFLGDGRPHQVLGGDGSWYDVTVAIRASTRERRPLVQLPDLRQPWFHGTDAVSETVTEEDSTDHGMSARYPERRVEVATTRSRTRSRGVTLRGGGMVLMPTHLPGLLAGLTASVSIPVRRVSTTAAAQQSVNHRSGQFADATVDVPRRIEYVVTVHKAGELASSTFRGEGRATVTVPTDHLVPDSAPFRAAELQPVSPDLARRIAAADSLNPMGVSGNGSPAVGRRGLFGTIAGVVHPALTAPGSSGRDVAFTASTADGVLSDLVAALTGWVNSGKLLSKDDSVHGSFRYRAMITHIAPVHEVGSPWLRSDRNSKSQHSVEVHRERGVEIAAGPAFGVGLMGSGPRARFWFSPLFGGQWRRFSSLATSVSARQGADTKGDRVLYEARVRLDYQGSGPLSPAMLAGRAVPYGQSSVTAWFSLRADEAAFLGIPLPAGLAQRPLFRHPGVERTLLAGPRGFSTAMSRFNTTQLVEEIEKVFALDQRLHGLLPQFGPENHTGGGLIDRLRQLTGNTDDIDRALTNHQILTETLSDSHLRARRDTLFTNGVVAVLRGKGRAHNKYVQVRVKGLASESGEYLGDADEWRVRSALELGTQAASGAAAGQVFGLGAGATGKPIPGHLYFSGSTALVFSGARARSGGPSTSNRSASSSAPQAALHTMDLGFSVEITLIERPRSWKRAVTPGTPGRQSPEVQVIARTEDVSPTLGVHSLRVDPVQVRLSTPVPFTLTPRERALLSPPGPERQVPVPPLRGISTMYDPRWAAPAPNEIRLGEWVHAADIGHPGSLQRLALDLLARAAGEDHALSSPGLDPALAIEDRLSPGAVTIGLGRGTGVTLIDDLHYKRRAGSVTGALGQRAELINPKVVHVADGSQTKNSLAAGHTAAASRSGGWSLSFAGTVGGAGNLHPRLWTWGGLGGTNRWGRSESLEQSSTGTIERIAVTSDTTPLILVQADLRVFQAAEVRVRLRSDGTQSGGILLPGAGAVWMTEGQARSQGLGYQLDTWLAGRDTDKPEDVPARSDASAAPSTPPGEQPHQRSAEGQGGLRLAGDGPLGLGIPEELPDFGQLLPMLKDSLAKTRGQEFVDVLLPERLLDDRYRNLQRLAAVLDRVAVPALLSGAIDGGVPVELFVGGPNGLHVYTARFSVQRGTGVFHDSPSDPRGFEYGSTVSIAESTTRGTITGFGLDAQLLPVPPISGNPTQGSLRPGAGVGFNGTSIRKRKSADEYVHSVNVVVPVHEKQVRLSIPFTATLSLYDRGLPEYGAPVVSVRMGPSGDAGHEERNTSGRVLGEVGDDGNLLADSNAGPRAAVDPGAQPSFLFRVPVVDLEALAHVSPPRARTLSIDDTRATLDIWRSRGVTLPQEAQANSFQGTQAVRRGLNELAKQVGGGNHLGTTGKSASYTVQEALSNEWLTAALPVLTARGLPLPDAHVPAFLRSQDLAVSLYARLTDGEVLGPVSNTTFEVADGGEAGLPALGGAHADTQEDQAGGWQSGFGWQRSGMSDLYDVGGEVALSAEGSALASQRGQGKTAMTMPSGPAVLVQFRNVDLRMVAALKRRLGHLADLSDIRSTYDVAMEHPVVFRMFRRSAARLLAGGALTDPRGHLGTSPDSGGITLATGTAAPGQPETPSAPHAFGAPQGPQGLKSHTMSVPLTPVVENEDQASSDPSAAEEPKTPQQHTTVAPVARPASEPAIALTDEQVHPADLRRLRYQHEAETYERRLGEYLSEHTDAVGQMALFARITWEHTPPAMRTGLGTLQKIVPGAVGLDQQVLEHVVKNGNFREHSTLVWNALRYGVFHTLLGTPTAPPPAITQARRWRGAPQDGPVIRRDPSIIRPALSPEESAFSPNGATWKSGEQQSSVNHAPPSRTDGDSRPLTFEDSPHVAAQPTGGLLMTGISGTVYSLLDAAEGANERWGAGLDLQWVRLALIGGMLTNRDHTLHELLPATELWANDEAHPKRRELGFDYDDNWGRYHRLVPLSEEELREHVAVGGRFPDERVDEFYTVKAHGPNVSAMPSLSQLLPEESWWRLFIDPNMHSEAYKNSPDDVGDFLDRTSYPGYRQSMTELYREVLDGNRSGRDWSRIDAAAFHELHNMATRHLISGAKRNVVTTWSQSDHRTTMRGTGTDRLASDLTDEVLLGRRLLFDIKEGRRPDAKPLAVLYRDRRGPQLSLDYGPGEAPLLVQAAMDRYYGELAVAGSSQDKLLAIARVTRAMQILQTKTDGNSRVNVHTLMQKFLLEQGFRPAILMDSKSLFLGGYTADEIVERLKEGMERFDQHVRWSKWDAFSQPREPLAAAQADQLAAEMGITSGSTQERRRQAIDTVRTARALFGHEITGPDIAEQLAALRSLSQAAGERHPEQAAHASVVALAEEVFALPSVEAVNLAHLRALLFAASRASAEGRPLRPDILRDLSPELPLGGGESASVAGGSEVDEGSKTGGLVGEADGDVAEAGEADAERKTLDFLVSELAGGGSLGSVEDLVGALMPHVGQEPLGGFGLVLRADAGSLGSDPDGVVSGLAAELSVPIELLLAEADDTVWRVRFDEYGSRRDAVLLRSEVALRATVRPGGGESASVAGGSEVDEGSKTGGLVGEADGDVAEAGEADAERKTLDFLVSELAGGGSLGSVEDLVGALMPHVGQEPLGGFGLVLRADAGSLGSDPDGVVSGLAAELSVPIELLLAEADDTVWRIRFDEYGSRRDTGPMGTEGVSDSVVSAGVWGAAGSVKGALAFGGDGYSSEPVSAVLGDGSGSESEAALLDLGAGPVS